VKALPAFGLALALALAGCARAPAPGVVTLLYASPYSPNHPFSRADQTWISWVEQRANGTLRIRPIWSGALLSSDQSMEELRHGVADIGLITPIYVRGGAHLIRIQSGFYEGARTIDQQVALYKCLAAGFPEYAHELDGLKVLAIQGGTLPGILTRSSPVRTLSDLQGLRLRAPTELLTVLRDYGADPVNMPMGQVYSALAKGIIDGVIAPADTLRSLHFSEVAHYFTQLQIPRGAYPARAMSERRWAELNPAQQQILQDGEVVWEAALAHETEVAVHAGELQGQKDGVIVLAVTPELQAQFNLRYQQHAAQNAQALDSFGIDGRAVFATAQLLAVKLERGEALDCANAPPAG
jgi:TRAP-type C4-dicarboxylate transport system substrate-binding protein